MPSALFLDNYDRSTGECRMRATDHNHSIRGRDIAGPLAKIGLGKEQDPRFADTFASLLIRALDRRDEPLAYQALAALTVLPADAVPVDTVASPQRRDPTTSATSPRIG